MRQLKVHYHPDIENLHGKSILKRLTTRAIALHGNDILLLYTERYHDYSLPGGGLDPGEDIVEGLIRELKEETGAKNINNIQAFGTYEEYRPWYKPDHDIIHIISYCFTCEIDRVLDQNSLESYEIENGMKPVWIDINEAISHNKTTVTQSPKKGLSIEREIFLLETIAEEFI